MNIEITRTTNEHRRNTWRQFVETLDHRTNPSKLWRTVKAIDGKSPPKAENEAITFDDTQVSSPKQIANYFNRQFTTSKLGRHTSSRETQIVSREISYKLQRCQVKCKDNPHWRSARLEVVTHAIQFLHG